MKKEQMIASRVPSDLVAELQRIEEVEHVDRSTAVRRLLYSAIREWKMEYATRLYRENRVTLGRAAADAGVSVREMMEYLRQKKVPGQYDLEDFEQDLKGTYARMGGREDVHRSR
jgi:predicted HTH domain antitoxin